MAWEARAVVTAASEAFKKGDRIMADPERFDPFFGVVVEETFLDERGVYLSYVVVQRDEPDERGRKWPKLSSVVVVPRRYCIKRQSKEEIAAAFEAFRWSDRPQRGGSEP